METWLTWCIKRPAPTSKLGYESTGAFHEGKKYLVAHSMEGPLSAGLGELDKLTRRASWAFSNPKVGDMLEHFAVTAVAWASGTLEANRDGVAVENEGKVGEPLTPSQIANLVRLCRDLQALFGWGPPSRETWLREHRDFSQTACPSNRIPWVTIIDTLNEEEAMNLEEKIAFKALQEKVAAIDKTLSETVARAIARIERKIDKHIDDDHS